MFTEIMSDIESTQERKEISISVQAEMRDMTEGFEPYM